jgi:hypothetical protein
LILDHHQVVAVAHLAAWGEVRRSGEYLGGRQIEIGHDKLVVLVNAVSSRPLLAKRGWRMSSEIGKIHEPDRSVGRANGTPVRYWPGCRDREN